ncbi:MAG: GTPase HflX [Gemmatimonadota bacterium]|nr:GTPase HflX [Gemmatimonadota bacterium]
MARELIDLAPPEERAILVGAPLKRGNARQVAHEHLEELGRLADTAGAHVVGTLTQQIDRPDPGTYIGKGKLEELRAMVADLKATVVIFDDELTPAQGKNLEGELTRRVIDRAELILDIFALRARTAEARMQVELAQLEYSLPRLRNLWTHLEKFRGGIGVRGPGETQLETDRRLVGQRIALLKERLREVEKSRAEQRKGRKGAFRAALVGYTNAGKSSILRAMAGGDVFVEDRLFATLDALTREVRLANGKGDATGDGRRVTEDGRSATTVLLTDTVGFIRKLPHHLVASFRATLEEVREADLLLHVIDASNPAWEEQRLVVDGVLDELGVHEKAVLHVFNKTDRLPEAEVAALRERMAHLLPGSVFVSARADGGIEPLRDALLDATRKDRPVVEVRLSPADGRRLAELHRHGEVLDTRHDEATGQLVVRARLDMATAAKFGVH